MRKAWAGNAVEMDARLLPRCQIANVSYIEPEKAVSMQKWIQTK